MNKRQFLILLLSSLFFGFYGWIERAAAVTDGQTIWAELLSLDDIEHNILRPRFKDPRVHFAINCSAVSCPPLRSEPYQGSSLDQQPDQATRLFINGPNSYRLEGDAFYVSRIFKWFAEDFNNDVLGFYMKYAREDLKKN